MMQVEKPFISANKSLPELTLRVVLLGSILSIILATSNAYLALKIGILTSASIPAAVISMSILQFFKQSNILENNLVQTAASAGEAVAGGIVYTLPALIIIGYWHHFNYFENFMIALLGGTLGVLFSIPLRRVLVTEPSLHFPEGQAIAEVLKLSVSSARSLIRVVMAAAVGGALEFLQTGLKLIASSSQFWFASNRTLIGFGVGFSPAMMGAGYIIGIELCASIFFGAVLGWAVLVPILSAWYPQFVQLGMTTSDEVMHLWGEKIRYVGIGSMMFAGLWTLIGLLKPFWKSLKLSLQAMSKPRNNIHNIPRTERDMPMTYVLFGIVTVTLCLYLFFSYLLPVDALGLPRSFQLDVVFLAVMYVIIPGFLFCALTGYFSGMVGVTATPGSSVIIAAILFAATSLLFLLQHVGGITLTDGARTAGEVITIFIGAVITGSAAIANDNIQDLKVGHLLGSTPWKQQIMLLLGVLVASAVIPLVMQLLFSVYGIANVMPFPGMDPAQSLPAPPASLMAAITQTVFNHSLPWNMIWLGMGLMASFLLLKVVLVRYIKVLSSLSLLGIAIGIYLPLASSIPLFIGGLIAWWTASALRKQKLNWTPAECLMGKHQGSLLACGLIAGAAIMDVLLAIPFSLLHSPDALRVLPASWSNITLIFAVFMTIGLGLWFYQTVLYKSPQKHK